ncbi:MAG: [FeFe] hydrogenase H-cluster radical SAM maturase HydE [Bacteroidota bacterium]
MTNKIIENLKFGKINKSEIVQLLKARGSLQKELFEQAKQTRQEFFGNKVFVRGVIEISNYCRKNCDYCAIRYSNKKLERYRLTPEEIFSVAKQINALGIQTLFIQSGEDPNTDKIVEEVLPKIKQELKINNIILCLGNRSKEQYKKFKELGANAYILKFETSDSILFQKIRHEPLEQRLQCLKWLKELGFEVGTGNITGLPEQTIESIAEDVLLAKKLNTEFVSTAPFVPNENTPLKKEPHGDFDLTLNTLAIWRIMLKNVLIPTVSALEKIKKGGQILGFNAGANVITVNFTPSQYRKKYLIYSKKRFVVTLNHALKTIKSAGLSPDIE